MPRATACGTHGSIISGSTSAVSCRASRHSSGVASSRGTAKKSYSDVGAAGMSSPAIGECDGDMIARALSVSLLSLAIAPVCNGSGSSGTAGSSVDRILGLFVDDGRPFLSSREAAVWDE